MITIYTDGSCLGNGKSQNSGGFGIVIVENEKVIFAYSKRSLNTTNNREELKAILYVLLNYGKYNPIVYSDSAYAINTLTQWMYNWARNNWIKSDKKTPENLDLIQTYYNYILKGYKIELKKVKGHNGNKWNEIADKLATGQLTSEEVLKIYG